MSRSRRFFVANACYHIMARGNQKQPIFYDAKDFNVYLKIMKKAKRKYGVLLYAYCLMPNHIHLLIESKSGCYMSKFMHWISRGYAMYFNDRYKKVGHLWQGRFRSKPILKGEYLIHCSDYIEANPVRGRLARHIEDYFWSSYIERCLNSEKKILDVVRK